MAAQPKPVEEITEEEFAAYEAIRQSGVTNMFNSRVVCELSDLSHDAYMGILQHYGALRDKYPDVRPR